MTPYTDAEIEEFRQEELTKQLEGHDEDMLKDREERFKPSSFGHHEALHTAYVQMEVWDAYVTQHPSVANDPDLYRQAWRAHEAMWEMYQLLGAKQE